MLFNLIKNRWGAKKIFLVRRSPQINSLPLRRWVSGPVPLVIMVTGPLTGPVNIINTGDREPDRSGREKIATFTVYNGSFV